MAIFERLDKVFSALKEHHNLNLTFDHMFSAGSTVQVGCKDLRAVSLVVFLTWWYNIYNNHIIRLLKRTTTNVFVGERPNLDLVFVTPREP